MAALNLGEIIATSQRAFTSRVADNLTKHIPLLLRLKGKGKIRTFPGGYEIQENLSYAGGNYERFSGYQRGNPSPTEGIDAATYPIRQARVPITISGLEQLQNAEGRTRILDLLEERMNNAERAMLNGINADLYSNGAADNGLQITGLAAQIVKDPTSGSVGNINRGTYDFWRNKFQATGTASATNIKRSMNLLYMGTTRGMDHVDLITLSDDLFGFLWDALSDQQRFMRPNSDMAKAGFDGLRFRSAEVIQGGGVGGAIPNNTGYFINTDYLKFRPHRDENMVFKDTGRPVDQDAMVKWLHWAGNLCSSNLSLQGLLAA